MAIKNVLIAYNGGPASDAALRFAVQLCEKYAAHLTGVLAHGVSNISRNIPRWLSGDMQQSIKAAITQKAEEIETQYHDAVRGALPADHVHWIEVGGNPDQTIADYAMLFDLTIVGQFENLVEADGMALHPDWITYKSGRPVILVPKSYEARNFNENAVLAWDGNRTATQALSAAMLVLETKDKVTVVTVESPGLGAPLEGVDVTTVLSRHGIASDRLQVKKVRSVADSVLNACNQVGAGLLVMGAYERSKLGQDLIGGVTNDIIRKTDIPVLMSH